MTDEERYDFIQENQFARLSFLQHAILHLMKPRGDGELHVRLDGDYEAILRLQSVEGELVANLINESWNQGYDKASSYYRVAV